MNGKRLSALSLVFILIFTFIANPVLAEVTEEELGHLYIKTYDENWLLFDATCTVVDLESGEPLEDGALLYDDQELGWKIDNSGSTVTIGIVAEYETKTQSWKSYSMVRVRPRRSETGEFDDGFRGSSDAKLTVSFIAAPVELTLDGNGGLTSDGKTTSTQIVPDGASIPLDGNPFVMEGGFFVGWNTEPDGSGDSYVPGQEFTYGDVDTLYAQWEEVDVATTLTEAGNSLRAQMKARKDVLKVQLKTTSSLNLTDLWNEAVKHIGPDDPIAGDYLRCQVGKTGMGAGSRSLNGYTYYDITMTPPYYTTLAQEEALTAMLDPILSSLNLSGKTDIEKFDAIYDYVVKHVVYDNANLYNDDYILKYTAYAALVDGTSVCQGYANLLYRMLLTAGVDTRIVTGTGTTEDENGNPRDEAHAWNIVCIDGIYYNVDATWDSNGYEALGEEYEYRYCLKGSAQFSRDHTAKNEFDSASIVTSTEDYVRTKSAPAFKKHAMILSEQIGVVFYMDLPAITGVDYGSSHMEFTVCGETVTVDYDANFKSEDGTLYGFTCPLNSAQVADEISASFKYAVSGTSKSVDQIYSAKDYVDYVDAHSSSFDDKTVELVHAIADYGHYAQEYFSDLRGWTIGTDHTAMPASGTGSYDYTAIGKAVGGYAIKRPANGAVSDIKFALEALSETKIYLYVTMSGSSVPTAKIGSEDLDVVKSGGAYKVTVASVKASELGKTFSVVLNDGSGVTSTVEVSVLSYADAVLNGGASGITNLDKDFVCALYEYHAAVQNYLN